MVEVETIDKRTRIPQEAILDVVEQIKTKFKPEKIILFGSYAHGNPRPESDVDLLVVMPTDLNRLSKPLKSGEILNFDSV